MKRIKKIATYAAIGGFGAIVMAGLTGCSDSNEEQSALSENVKQGAFVIIEETAPGSYKILEEYPSSETRVVLKQLDGSEKILSQAEIDQLLAEANAKIDAGTSGLTNAQISSGGMGLGEMILASAAGAILGSWIGNKLFNNQNFQSQRQNAYKNPSTYSRSVNSFNQARQGTASSPKGSSKSGFFGGSGKSSSSSSQSTGG